MNRRRIFDATVGGTDPTVNRKAGAHINRAAKKMTNCLGGARGGFFKMNLNCEIKDWLSGEGIGETAEHSKA